VITYAIHSHSRCNAISMVVKSDVQTDDDNNGGV